MEPTVKLSHDLRVAALLRDRGFEMEKMDVALGPKGYFIIKLQHQAPWRLFWIIPMNPLPLRVVFAEICFDAPSKGQVELKVWGRAHVEEATVMGRQIAECLGMPVNLLLEREDVSSVFAVIGGGSDDSV